LLISIAALLLAAAEPAVAPPAPPAPAAADAPKRAKTPAEDRICWSETPLGTRFSHRVCATRAELDARRRNSQDFIDRATSGQVK
jgi:hypothetical protein